MGPSQVVKTISNKSKPIKKERFVPDFYSKVTKTSFNPCKKLLWLGSLNKSTEKSFSSNLKPTQ